MSNGPWLGVEGKRNGLEGRDVLLLNCEAGQWTDDSIRLARQVRAATDHAANAAVRLAGKELLKFANDETTIAQLKDRIARTIDYLKSVK